MSDTIDEGIMRLSDPVIRLLRRLEYIPTCWYSQQLPLWEAEVIYDLCQIFDIKSPVPDKISFTDCLKLKGNILREANFRADKYAQAGADRYDILEKDMFKEVENGPHEEG